jgi:hypothetical protein
MEKDRVPDQSLWGRSPIGKGKLRKGNRNPQLVVYSMQSVDAAEIRCRCSYPCIRFAYSFAVDCGRSVRPTVPWPGPRGGLF